ncbi:hypothetical protein OC846_005055 [Tilletia horrida]|uniref:Zn(2)-C6 fungal-type domain-containing protein n=1 Tax=Tilletia horrida TaxID=155126 RepID=A0AAN6GM11_9BASI|nr:hypothetical protein OC846_005055 [Tilletia horrida]KAK0562530.1 hypothetical protein OC861_005257 [Tilletia horrida]
MDGQQPPDGGIQNNGLRTSNTNGTTQPNPDRPSGILHSQLSWGPRAGLQQQLRPTNAAGPSIGMGSSHDLQQQQQQQQQQQHMLSQPQGPKPPEVPLYPGNPGPVNGASSMSPSSMPQAQFSASGVGAHPGAATEPAMNHMPNMSALNGSNGNIFDASNWGAMPNMNTARDFALNFHSADGAWNPPPAGARGGPVLNVVPSGCLHAAAEHHQHLLLQQSRPNGTGMPGQPSTPHGMPSSFSLPGSHHSGMGAAGPSGPHSSANGANDNSNAFGQPQPGHPPPGQPHISALQNPHTPISPSVPVFPPPIDGTNLNPAQTHSSNDHAAGNPGTNGLDHSYMHALFADPNASLTRRFSVSEGAAGSSASVPTMGTPGAVPGSAHNMHGFGLAGPSLGTPAQNLGGHVSHFGMHNNAASGHTDRNVPLQSPLGSVSTWSSASQPMTSPANLGMVHARSMSTNSSDKGTGSAPLSSPTESVPRSGSGQFPTYYPQMAAPLEPYLFAPLGENLAGGPSSDLLPSSISGGGMHPGHPGGAHSHVPSITTSANQLSMTDPFHAVSLELWRQLGYSTSQTYGILGADGLRAQAGGAMILETADPDGMASMDPHTPEGALGSAIALSGAPAMNGLGHAGSDHFGSGGFNEVGNRGKGKGVPNNAVSSFYRSRAPMGSEADNANGEADDDEIEDDEALGSDDDGDDDDGPEGADPESKAARLSAKKLRMHRRQGVTCDQCRSKHLRCDLSDRKFKAFEATLHRSIGPFDKDDPSAHARQEAALAVQAEDEAKLDAAAAAKATASGTPVILNNPIRCSRCEKRGLVCTKSYNPPSKRHPRPSRTGKRIEQARQLHGSRSAGDGTVIPLTPREHALEDVFNMLAGEADLSEVQSTDSKLYKRILASSINIRLLTTYFAVFHIQMPVIDFDNFCYRFNFANGDARKMAIMANGGDDEEGLPSAMPEHRNLLMSESSDPRDSTISTPGTVEALIAAMHLCAALYTDMPLIQPMNSRKLFRSSTAGRAIRPLPSRGSLGGDAANNGGSAEPGRETVNSFILPHPKGSKEDQATEEAIEAAAAEAAGKRSNKRLKRKQGVACDSCRLRRVRCDLTERPKGASCTRCEDKKINCTAEYIESIRAKGKTVVLDIVHAKAEAAQKNRERDREVSKERLTAAAAALAAARNTLGPEMSSGGAASGEAGGQADAEGSTTGASAMGEVEATGATAMAAALVGDEDMDEEEDDASDDDRVLERAQERWVRSGAIGKEFGQLKIDGSSVSPSSSTKTIGGANGEGSDGGDDNTVRSTSRDVDMGSWTRVRPQVPDTADLIDHKDMLRWGRARQGFFKKLKDRAIELVYRHDLLHRPSSEAIQTLLILCHILYAVDPVQVKLFASVALKHIKALNLQSRHEVYEQDQEAVEHLLTDMQASRVYLTSWTRDGIMAGMYRSEPNFPEERTIQVKGGQRPFDPSDQLNRAAISGPSGQMAMQSPGTKELSGQMGLTFSIMAMTQIGALSRFVAKHIDRTEGVPAGASATDRFPLLPTAGDMKKLTRACNAVWQGTDALLQFFDKCAARSREDMERLKPFQPLPWIGMLKMCGAMLDLAVYRVLSERYGVNAAYLAAITRQIQMSNGTALNPKIRPLSEDDFEQAKALRSLFEKGRNRAMIRSRRTAHLAAFLLRKNVFQFGGVIMRQLFAVSQFLARMPCEDTRLARMAAEQAAGTITTLENTPQQSTRGSVPPEDGGSVPATSPAPTTMSVSTSALQSPPATSPNFPSSSFQGSNAMVIQNRASSPSSMSATSGARTESSFRTNASVEGEGHVPWYVGARELGPFDNAAKKREVGWCLEAMAQIGYAWPDMELKISSVEAIMRAEGLLP